MIPNVQVLKPNSTVHLLTSSATKFSGCLMACCYYQ